jgi:hypothetical protein
MDHRTHNFGGAMEDKAGFDLNDALRRWRRGLAGRAGLQGENLEELESHLRESVATLEHSGLSSEEAFFVALRRLGSAEALGREFALVHSRSVWLDRLLWVLVGYTTVTGLIQFFRSLYFILLLPLAMRGDGTILAIWILSLLLVGWGVRRLVRGAPPAIVKRTVERPFALALLMFGVYLSARLPGLLNLYNIMPAASFSSRRLFAVVLWDMVWGLFLAGAILALARTRNRTVEV